MKIVFPYMARWSAAHASRYFHLLTHVAEEGHEVHVIQPPSRGSEEANDIDVALPDHPNVKVHTYPMPSWFWHAKFPLEKIIKKIVYSVCTVPAVRRLSRETEADLLYLYNLPQAVYLFGRRPAVVFDVADDLLGMLEVELGIGPRHPVHRVARALFEWILKRADVVICISGPLFQNLKHPSKHLLPNGGPLERSVSLNDSTGESKRNSKVTVGFVGAFEYSMALDQMLDAAALAPDLQFLLIGAGRDGARIKDRVVDEDLANVELTGALSHRDAMMRLQEADVCLNLFYKTRVSHAVSPLKLFEYLALRKPVITTRLEEVQRIDPGIFYYADDATEIVTQVRRIERDPPEAERRVRAGTELLRTSYTWEVLARRFITVTGPALKG